MSKINILKKGKHGAQINTDVTDQLILSVPPENIHASNGEIVTLFGIGCVIFMKNKTGNEVKAQFVIATVFNSKPTAIRPSTHFNGYTDLIFDKDAYILYVEQDLTGQTGVPIIKDSTNVELMYNKLNGGKFSSYVSYDHQMDVIMNNQSLNKRLGNSPLIFDELSIADGFVDEKGRPYRYSLKGRAYPASLLSIAMMKDPFSAVIHQDAKTSLMISLNNDEDKEPSLLEKHAFM